VIAKCSPWSAPFPPQPPPPIARLCSAGSSVLRGGPTPRHRSCGPFGFCLLPPDCAAPRGQSMPRSPGSRACSFSACSGSSTTQGRPTARAIAAAHVAFPFCRQGRRPELVLRSSIPVPPIPPSTLHSSPRGGQRKTQGQDGSLLLSCRTLSFPTTCRFIPAHRQATSTVNSKQRVLFSNRQSRLQNAKDKQQRNHVHKVSFGPSAKFVSTRGLPLDNVIPTSLYVVPFQG
jgi:hypothetical protein